MLKLPKRFHPDFAQPKKKPSGPVVIDYSIAPKGTKIWLGPARELSGDSYTYNGNAAYSRDYFEFDGAGDYLDCGSYDFMQSETFTVIAVCSDFVNSSSRSICGFGGSGNTGWTLRYDQYAADNKFGFTKFGVADGNLNIECPFGQKNVAIAITFDGTNVKFCVNGQSVSITMSAILSSSSSKFVIGGAWKSGAFISGGIFKCHMLAVLPVTVPETRLRALTLDPYQILKPANDLYYFIPAGGGTTYEVSANYAQTFGITTTKSAAISASASFSQSFSMSQGANGTLNTSADFSQIMQTVAQSVAALGAQINAGITSDTTAANNASMNASAAFNTTQSTIAASTATLNAEAVFNTQHGVSSAGGLSLQVAAAFAVQHAMQSNADISIEAIADFGMSVGMLCSAVAEANAQIDINVIHSAVADTLAILNAQASYGITSGLSVTRGIDVEAGITCSITSSFTATGSIIVSGSITTPDSRTLKILAENRTLTIFFENRTLKIEV